MCTNNIFIEHTCVHTCMWLKEYCAMNTLSTENVHWEQVHTGKILLLDVLRGNNKTINLQIYKSYVDASEKNKGMSYNLWNPSEHIKESEEGARTKRQEEKKTLLLEFLWEKRINWALLLWLALMVYIDEYAVNPLASLLLFLFSRKTSWDWESFSTYSETYCSFLVGLIYLITSPSG